MKGRKYSSLKSKKTWYGMKGKKECYDENYTMKKAISETERRREIQMQYNEEHGIVPTTIIKKVHEIIKATITPAEKKGMGLDKDPESMSEKELNKVIKNLEKEMKQAALDLQFERAANLRDEVMELRKLLNNF